MASRLSEETLKAAYDSGHQALAVEGENALALLAPATVDLERLLTEEDPEAAVQAVPAQMLYQSLMRRGLADSLEVIQLLSREQLVRMVDYDAWFEDRLVPGHAFRWLSLYKEHGAEELYKRYRELDEEYQVSLLAPFIEIFDEDQYEKMTDSEQDTLHRMPCGTMFYQIKSEDPKVQEFIPDLIEAALGQDVGYAYSLLAHAAFVPPNEPEAMIAQFRRARLEEDGFVSYEESLEAFRDLDPDALRQKWAPAREGGVALQPAADAAAAEPFVVRAVRRASATMDQDSFAVMLHAFASLGNALCAAARVETDDLVGQQRILQQAQALASLGLEYAAGGDLDTGARILGGEHPQVLFRAGLALVRRLQAATMQRLERARIHKLADVSKAWQLGRSGLLLARMDAVLLQALGFERTETLKGLFNRFPVRPARVATGGDGVRRMLYKPIASLAELRELAAALDGTAGLLHLAGLAVDAPAELVDLDRQLMTALARVLAGGAFKAEPPLTADELARVEALPGAAAQAAAANFFESLAGTLRADADATGGWPVSGAIGLGAGDPVQPAMAEFSDLVMRLQAARESERTAGLVLTDRSAAEPGKETHG